MFDAIDAGNWASAQAGIATLPRGLLTPVAKAELYTAKGSPVVDLASLQALVAQAPELPEADQLSAIAIKRGALTPPLTVPEKPTYSLSSAPIRYKAKAVLGEPYADQLRALLDPLIKANDSSGAESQLLIYAPQLSIEARAEAAQRVAFAYYCTDWIWTPAVSPTPGARARPANGRARRPGFRASLPGGSATGTPPRARSSKLRNWPSSESSAPPVIIGPRGQNRQPDVPVRSNACLSRRHQPPKRRKASTACSLERLLA